MRDHFIFWGGFKNLINEENFQVKVVGQVKGRIIVFSEIPVLTNFTLDAQNEFVFRSDFYGRFFPICEANSIQDLGLNISNSPETASDTSWVFQEGFEI